MQSQCILSCPRPPALCCLPALNTFAAAAAPAPPPFLDFSSSHSSSRCRTPKPSAWPLGRNWTSMGLMMPSLPYGEKGVCVVGGGMCDR